VRGGRTGADRFEDAAGDVASNVDGFDGTGVAAAGAARCAVVTAPGA
jgi:hypothetical protein